MRKIITTLFVIITFPVWLPIVIVLSLIILFSDKFIELKEIINKLNNKHEKR